MIRFVCQECETSLKVADEKAGSKIACPRCKTTVKVPGSAAKKKSARAEDDDLDDEDEDDRPRKGKKPAKKGDSRVGMYVAVGVGACAVVAVIGGVLAFGGKGKDENKPNPPAANAGGPPAGMTMPAAAMPGMPGMTPPAAAPPAGGTAVAAADTTPKPAADTAVKPSGSDSARPAATETARLPVPEAPESGGADGDKVTDRLLKSTVFIMFSKDDKPKWEGSGSLVDYKNKLILTNYHVSGEPGEGQLTVFFPQKERGQLAADRKLYYRMYKSGQGLHGITEVVRQKKDLALLRIVEGLPDGVLPLPIAAASPRQGQGVHSLGNPKEALWIYTHGTVRHVGAKHWLAGDETKVHEFDAQVVVTQSPTNHGDSGGPMVNDRRELVGVTQGGDPNENLVSYSIDVTEVRSMLNEYYRSKGLPVLPESGGGDTGGAGSGDVLALARALDDKDAKRRASSARSLGQKGPEAKAAVPYLVKALKDRDEAVRRNAAEAIDLIGYANREHVTDLCAALKDTDPDVRTFVSSVLRKMGRNAKAAVPELVKATEDNDPTVRQNAIEALANAGRDAPGAIPALIKVLNDDAEIDVRVKAASALKQFGPAGKPAAPALGEAIKNNSNKELRITAATALAEIGPDAKAALPVVIELLQDRDKETRLAAMAALRAIGVPDPKDGKEAARRIILFFEDPELKTAGAETLGKIGKPAVPELIKALSNTNPYVRVGACEALGAIGPDAATAIPALNRTRSNDFLVSNAAAAAIAKIKIK